MPSNPLTDVLTPKYRQIMYAVLFVAALGFSAWQAAGGDWLQAVGGIVTALFGATAASNVPAPTVSPADKPAAPPAAPPAA